MLKRLINEETTVQDVLILKDEMTVYLATIELRLSFWDKRSKR